MAAATNSDSDRRGSGFVESTVRAMMRGIRIGGFVGGPISLLLIAPALALAAFGVATRGVWLLPRLLLSGVGFIDTPLPQTQDVRTVARLLMIDAAIRAHDGNPDGALESCSAILGAGRSIGDEPFLIGGARSHRDRIRRSPVLARRSRSDGPL